MLDGAWIAGEGEPLHPRFIVPAPTLKNHSIICFEKNSKHTLIYDIIQMTDMYMNDS